MTSTSHSTAAEIHARMDRLPITPRHRFAVVAVGIGMFFDLYEVFLAGTLATVLGKEFGVTGTAQKLVLASAFIGAFLGAITLSRLADRLGRRRAFFLTLGIYSVFSVLAAFSPNVELLILFRFLAGVGIGAELPLCDAYLSDLLPARKRGRMIAWAYTLGFCGVPVAGLLARVITPHTFLGLEGWRWMFLLGGIGAILCWAMRRGLPESPRWLASVGRGEEADAVVRTFEAQAGALAPPEPVADTAPPKREPVRALFRAPWRTRTIMLWIFQLFQTFGYYGFGTLVPLVLAAKGYDVVQGLTFTALSFLGYPIGSALSIPLIERFERKTMIVGAALGMIVLGLAFGYSSSAVAIVLLGFGYTVVSNLFSNGFHVYSGELFPTTLRATGAGSAYSLSRLATAVMPFLLVPLLDSAGPTAVFAAIAGAMLIVAVDVAVLGPRTTGRSLADISSTAGPPAAR
ncbi:MFS transporter [Pseudonocardia oroxyli]|uniref:MFS transporter, putative metabolite:H+ symporter n=1 Tax=Pseudonocardia oroxyli TaxID=366584 RepID=A0A1G7I6K7_PSEOR|nr:MFS transporter [Pseudonocardia oroxyli]SDF08351.1 MFS transporter, putative metabolite:H+ symporter [Pseudonocardia oroxyli]